MLWVPHETGQKTNDCKLTSVIDYENLKKKQLFLCKIMKRHWKLWKDLGERKVNEWKKKCEDSKREVRVIKISYGTSEQKKV